MSAVMKMRVPNNGAPHKSTTHEERYYHIGNEATVFFREEDDGKWYASVSLCHWRDNFSRAVGRKVARRKYFTKPEEKVEINGPPSYEEAEALVGQAAFIHRYYN